MTRLLDGPGSGQVLELQRSPLFLRVVIGADGKVDALDLLSDEPSAGEAIHVYRRQGGVSVCFLDYTDRVTRKRRGKRLSFADYRLHQVQPADEVLRDQGAWRAWATAEMNKGITDRKGG